MAHNNRRNIGKLQTPVVTDPIGYPIIAGQALSHALLAGSRVLTARGNWPIEDISTGDRIITREQGIVQAQAVVSLDSVDSVPMVLIPKGALGRGRPQRDIQVLHTQPLAMRGWRARLIYRAPEVRVAAGRMVDNRVIISTRSKASPAFALILKKPMTLYVEGLELVSGAVQDRAA